MYKVIATDLDGTLLQNGIRVLREDMVPLIRDYVRRGGIFLPASGRQHLNLQHLFSGIEDEISYIAENGCLVFHKGELIYRSTMSREDGIATTRAIMDIPGARVAISGVECTYILKGQDFFSHITNYVKNKAVELDSPEDMPEDFFKVSAYSKDGVELFDKKLKDLFSDHLTVVTSGNFWTDIMPQGVHKGTGLKALSEHTGIPLSEFVALGDHYNDLEMMSMVGHPACVDNAVPEIMAISEKHMENGCDLLKYYLTA